MQSVPFQKYKSFAKVNRNHIVCLKKTQSTIWTSDPYINTPYENFEGDVKKLIKHLSNQKNKLNKSPPFYGSMMSLIFKKK